MHDNLQKLVFIHCNMRLRQKNAKKDQDLEDYTDPIDLTDNFYKGEEDSPYEWVREVEELVLDEPGRRPSSHITSQMGVNVDDFMERPQQSQPQVVGGLVDDEDE